MSWLSKYLGGQQGGQAPTGAETIERLCDRVQSSTLLDDRRDAVRALKSLSKKYRLEVGTQAMTILINVLQMDRNDTEITRFALETLCNVMSSEPPDDDEGLLENNVGGGGGGHSLADHAEIGEKFTEVFISGPDNVSLLLSLLDEYDFYVRWPTVRLLTLLLTSRTREIQEVVLANPMGVSKLMDLLADSRDVIRNDGLLLLTQLTKNNTNIQKIVAFENAFERLFEIIRDEGNSDGGVVVEDALVLLLNLLKNNLSNQNYFKEGSYIKRLPPFFQLGAGEGEEMAGPGGWSAQKVTNIHLMLNLVRCLVSPGNPQQQTAACQKVMNQCGLLSTLCDILMASGVPADVLTETINTVSEIMRGNPQNQEVFAGVMAPSNPPRPAIVVLLMSMVNDKQPLVLRCAVLYCFESFLFKNELGQSQIIQTLLPTTAEVNAISAGQLLCGGLFSADSLSTWFAAVALLHAIVNNTAQKEQLLRVQLATSVGNPPVSLLQQCTNILAQGGPVQTRVGLLMLLCNWLAGCPIAVTHFLHNAANVPFLISQIASSGAEGDDNELLVQGLCAFLLGLAVLYNSDQVETAKKASLRQIIERRIGLEMFGERLSQLSRHEAYARAAKRPQVTPSSGGGPPGSHVLFDYEFTKLVKKLENDVLKAVSPASQDAAGELGEQKTQNIEQHDSIVTQYKDIIREQDTQLNSVRSELTTAQQRLTEQEKQMDELKQNVQMLKDQNALLKASKGGNGSSAPTSEVTPGSPDDDARLQQEIDAKNREIEEKTTQIEQLTRDLCAASSASGGATPAPAESSEDLTKLKQEVEELRHKVDQKDEEIRLYRTKYEDTSRQVAALAAAAGSDSAPPAASADSAPDSALLAERDSLSARVAALEAELRTAQEQKAEAEKRASAGAVETEATRVKLQEAESARVGLEMAKAEVDEELDTNKKEQEDLLVLLADQDTKIKDYRARLKALGETLDSDDDDDFDDENVGDGDSSPDVDDV